MVTTDTAAIIAAIETELAAEWYAHAAAERRAQRVTADVVEDAPSLGDFALAVCIWAVFPAALVWCMWVLVG